jgi:hypothetical protein
VPDGQIDQNRRTRCSRGKALRAVIPVVSDDTRLTTDELSSLADSGAGVIAASGAEHVAHVGTGAVCLYARGAALTPLNYRLSADGDKLIA